LLLQMGASPVKSGYFWHRHVFSPTVSNRLDWYMWISYWFKLSCLRQSHCTSCTLYILSCFTYFLLNSSLAYSLSLLNTSFYKKSLSIRKHFCLLNFLSEWLDPVCFHLLPQTN
jgi:hypothetical protein